MTKNRNDAKPRSVNNAKAKDAGSAKLKNGSNTNTSPSVKPKGDGSANQKSSAVVSPQGSKVGNAQAKGRDNANRDNAKSSNADKTGKPKRMDDRSSQRTAASGRTETGSVKIVRSSANQTRQNVKRPVQAASVKSGQMKSAPAQSTSKQTKPRQTKPVQDSPVKPAPKQERVPRTASNVPHTEQTGSAAKSMKSNSTKPAGRPAKSGRPANSPHTSKFGRARVPRARRMSLSLTHVDPRSVAKVAFLLSVAGALIQIVAVFLIWMLLDVIGVFDQVTQIVSSTGLDAGGFNLSSVLSLGTVLGGISILSIVEIVLITLLAAIGAALYNVVAQFVGGIHVTLGDD